ncbi:MAG: choice-of-anchor B family protein [Acidobacteriota bacterium]
MSLRSNAGARRSWLRALSISIVALRAAASLAGTEPCTGGKAGPFPCSRVDLLAFVPIDLLAAPGAFAGDVWGWEDPVTGDEYRPLRPDHRGLDRQDPRPESTRRRGPAAPPAPPGAAAMRVTKDHALIAGSYQEASSAGAGPSAASHDRNPPVTFAETVLRWAQRLAHPRARRGHGLPLRQSPRCELPGRRHPRRRRAGATTTFAACIGGFGSTHDGQCVVYNGPDTAHAGAEICFNFDVGKIRIIDVTSKSAPALIAELTYPGASYAHQGALTEDQRFIVEDDELDEYDLGHPTRTRIFDVSDLDNPILIGAYDAPTRATDHNQYVRGRFDYQGNYRAGVRILDLANVASGTLTEQGFLDTFPGSDSVGFAGSWGPYPYFGSGVIAELDMGKGLLLVKPHLCGITLSGTPLPDGSAGVPYSETVSASGGTAPYVHASFGILPPGITLTAAGVLGGPDELGVYRFHVRTTDASACDETETLTLIVHAAGCPPVSIGPSSLPGGIDEVPYSQTVTATGGTAPYAFAVTGGALPVGLALSTSGAISGSPVVPGTATFRVTATDASGCTGSATLSIAIGAQPCGAITLAPSTLQEAARGAPYTEQLFASGGTPPHTFSLASGSLPPGLALSPAGRISGIATGRGAPFTVVAADARGCLGSSRFLIDVSYVPPFDCLVGQGAGQPNPNEVRGYYYSTAFPYLTFLPYSAGAWGVNASSGNVDGNSEDELLTGPGPGPTLGPQVRGFDGYAAPLGKINFFAYGTLRFGVSASGASLDADAYDEILTGAGPGAVFGPHVRGFNYDRASLTAIAKLSYFAYGTLKYGVGVERSDVDLDEYEEVLTAPGPGASFGPQVRGWNFDGTSVSAIAKINFNAFPAPQYGGNVAGGDADGDTAGEIAAAGGAGPPIASSFRGFDYGPSGILGLPGFDVTPYATSYGGRLAMATFIYQAPNAQLLTGPGPDPAASATLCVYDYDGASLTQTWSLTPFTSSYGLNVGSGMLNR